MADLSATKQSDLEIGPPCRPQKFVGDISGRSVG